MTGQYPHEIAKEAIVRRGESPFRRTGFFLFFKIITLFFSASIKGGHVPSFIRRPRNRKSRQDRGHGGKTIFKYAAECGSAFHWTVRRRWRWGMMSPQIHFALAIMIAASPRPGPGLGPDPDPEELIEPRRHWHSQSVGSVVPAKCSITSQARRLAAKSGPSSAGSVAATHCCYFTLPVHILGILRQSKFIECVPTSTNSKIFAK